MPLRLVLSAAMLLVSAFVGALAGNAAVAGMGGLSQGAAPPTIGDERAILAGLPEDPTAWSPPEMREPGLATVAMTERADCLDCSDYEAGYRWAAAREIEDADACDGDSAAFADGCAAYVGDGAVARDS